MRWNRSLLVAVGGSCLIVLVQVGCESAREGPGPAAPPNYRSQILSHPATMTRGSTYAITVCTTNTSTMDSGVLQTATYIFINTSSNLTGAVALASPLVLPLPKKGYTNWTGNITIPTNRPTGVNYLISFADYLKEQIETNENDNTNVVAVTIN